MRRIFFLFLLAFCFTINANAQLFEPAEEEDTTAATSAADEELFMEPEDLYDEMFNDYDDKIHLPEDNEGVFNKSADKVVDAIKKIENFNALNKKKTEEEIEEEEKLLEGKIKVGLTKGSFLFFKDILGRTKCAFGVTVRSEINKTINNLTFRLVYPDDNRFAFIFRNLKPNTAEEHFITTDGDICFYIDGTPHIDLNKCRIHNVREDECVKMLEWDPNIETPDASKHPYFK